jgi:hypothetical protein
MCLLDTLLNVDNVGDSARVFLMDTDLGQTFFAPLLWQDPQKMVI